MEWVKTTAKTLPEAIDLALDNLGVDESEAEIVVLEEPRPGLFGRMRGTARVEARVKPKAIRPKIERNRNRRSRSEGGSKGKGGDRGKNRSRNRSGGQSGSRDGGRSGGDGGKGDGGGRGRGKDESSASGNDRSAGSKGPNDTGSGRGSGSGGKGRGRGGREEGRTRSQGRSSSNDHDTKPKEDTPVEEVEEHLRTFLSGLTEAFGFDSEVTVDSSEQDVLIGRIEGQHGLLVGPKGRTLDAVQELARISCQRAVPSSIRIKVDVGGYREQRIAALGEFARKAAASAVEESAEVALEPMSAADRKAVHDALSEDDRVETRSVGSEPRRKVLVVPLVDADEDDEEDDDEETANGSADDGNEQVDDTATDTATDDTDTDTDDIGQEDEGDLVDAGGGEVED